MLVLVRHGESTANASGLLLGRSDVALTEKGEAQARAVGAGLGTVALLISSPLRRALDTAALLETGAAVTVDERWIEVDYGIHEGSKLSAVPADVWRQWRADPSFRPEGGETLAEVGARVAKACEELFDGPNAPARRDDGDVVVVSHVSPIKAAMAWALGVPGGLDWKLQLSTGSTSRIAWGPEGPVVHTYNSVPTP